MSKEYATTNLQIQLTLREVTLTAGKEAKNFHQISIITAEYHHFKIICSKFFQDLVHLFVDIFQCMPCQVLGLRSADSRLEQTLFYQRTHTSNPQVGIGTTTR